MLFRKSVGVARWAYNYCIAEKERVYKEYLDNDNITHCCEEIDTLKNKAKINKKERNLEFWRGCYDAACVLRRENGKDIDCYN